MYKYTYDDEPEPKEPFETTEDKIIKHGRKIFNTALLVFGAFLLVLFIYGFILRHF